MLPTCFVILKIVPIAFSYEWCSSFSAYNILICFSDLTYSSTSMANLELENSGSMDTYFSDIILMESAE